jgi:hypothetical protein
MQAYDELLQQQQRLQQPHLVFFRRHTYMSIVKLKTDPSRAVVGLTVIFTRTSRGPGVGGEGEGDGGGGAGAARNGNLQQRWS